ncbi:MAG: acyltransferase family protein, partial [Agathobacter sp.]|nr:acyltransferase family protein [Agathobacter sp.]
MIAYRWINVVAKEKEIVSMYVKNEYEHSTIQMLRGFAILLVVFHHVANAITVPSVVATAVSIVNRIHVVVFFVIAGYLFEKNKVKYMQLGLANFCKNKFLQLMVPYFIFSFAFSMLLYVLALFPMTTSFVHGIGNGIHKGIPK